MTRRLTACAWGARCATALAVLLFGWALSPPAQALDPVDAPPDTGDFDALSAGTGGLHNHWAGTGRRPFLAGVYDVGLFYVQPSIAVGYGEPHHRWFGLSGAVDMATSGGSGKLALRGATPYFDARMGVRYEVPTDQYYLSPRESFTREDTELEDHGASRYLSLDAELTGRLPMPGGHLIAVASGYGLLHTPRDLYLFEEALKVVVEPPFLWRARLGYMGTLSFGRGEEQAVHLGGGFEAIHNPARGAFVARIGPLARLPLTCHLEMIAAAMFVVHSPDRLGLLGADFGEIALRYRWAFGDPTPGFP